jgi:SAM-dependent methyltransferase
MCDLVESVIPRVSSHSRGQPPHNPDAAPLRTQTACQGTLRDVTSEPTQLWASCDAAARWRRTAAERQRAVGAATQQMLDTLQLQPGFRVLDLAAGTGDTSILAAQRVGPRGSVLAVDISAAMLQQAEAAARDEGLTTIHTLVADIQALELAPQSFDAALARFGLMFLSDPVEGMRRINRALKPRARLAALVWATEERNPFISIPLAAARRLNQLPTEGSPLRRALSLGGPGVFERMLREAGFMDVEVKPTPIPREFESIDGAVESIRSNSALVRELMAGLDDSGQQNLLAEIRRQLAAFARNDGRCVVPGEALLGVAA